MGKTVYYINKILNNPRIKQVFFLYLSMVANVLLGLGISIITTRNLGPNEYGKFSYVVNLFTLVSICINFGVYIAGQRLIANYKYVYLKTKIFAGLLWFSIITSIILVIILFGYSFIDDYIYNNNMGFIIRLFSPLIIIFPFQNLLESILSGDNRISLLSINRTGPKFFYVITLLTTILITNRLTTVNVLFFYFFTMLLFYIITLFIIKPDIWQAKKSFHILKKEVKSYGIHEYIGSLTEVVTDKIAFFSILYFLSNTQVGFFSLACTVAGPLALISGVVGTSFYKEFANSQKLPRKATRVTLGLSFLSLIFFMLLIKPIIFLFYSKSYIAVADIAYITSIGFILRGLGDYVNKFLGAHGKGVQIRNSSFVNGVFNILGYTILVYYFGLIGAAITKFLSGAIYLFSMLYFYKKNFIGIDANPTI